jgi:hypothetical protein
MTVSINLSPEMEASLQRQAAATGKDVSAVVESVVLDYLANDSGSPNATVTAEEFEAWFRKFTQHFPTTPMHVDDSRESIYAGRGE